MNTDFKGPVVQVTMVIGTLQDGLPFFGMEGVRVTQTLDGEVKAPMEDWDILAMLYRSLMLREVSNGSQPAGEESVHVLRPGCSALN